MRQTKGGTQKSKNEIKAPKKGLDDYFGDLRQLLNCTTSVCTMCKIDDEENVLLLELIKWQIFSSGQFIENVLYLMLEVIVGLISVKRYRKVF